MPLDVGLDGLLPLIAGGDLFAVEENRDLIIAGVFSLAATEPPWNEVFRK